MNKQWVDEHLEMLSLRLKDFKPQPFYEPTEHIYERLESGDEHDLQFVASEISSYLGLNPVPKVIYDWGLKMEPDVAGQIIPAVYEIRIPFFYAGKRHAVGSILAHEMSHAFLFCQGIWLEKLDENELLTDLAAVFLGLGNLLRNGLIVASNELGADVYLIGYLSPDLIDYGYQKVNASRSINI
jgi:hypothetical protein